MAGTPTTNYNIPTYAASDAPDLTAAYNAAMTTIDTQMKSNETSAASAKAEADANKTNIAANTSDITALQSTTSTHTSQISKLQTDVSKLQSGSFAPSDSDKTLTVAQLGEAKVTSAGIVYFKQS